MTYDLFDKRCPEQENPTETETWLVVARDHENRASFRKLQMI